MALPDTPIGGTMALATQGGTYSFMFIGPIEEVLEIINVSHLGTTNQHEKTHADLVDIPPIPVRVQFDGGDGLPNIGATPETITITFPQNTGEATPANYTGTGFLHRRQFPEMDIGNANGILLAEFNIVYNGGFNSGTEGTYNAAT